MGKASFVCPHCNKQKLEIHFDDKRDQRVTKVKGGKFDPVLTQLDDGRWTESSTNGISVTCKCGKHSIIYGFHQGSEAIRISTEVQENQLIGGFCSKCRSGFLAKSHTCPTCSTEI